MDISLVVLAAGIGSRFGGVKQLEGVGPNGEAIIDYSIHDAIAAGFNKIVFILRKDIFEDFKESVGSRLEKNFKHLGIKLEYVFQELVDPPEGRTKPWGTGQALMACRGAVNEPFAVINSDDYYGRDAYVRAYEFLKERRPEEPRRYGMVGFVLKNTLSDIGGVTRGVCAVDESGYLTKIVETSNIIKTPDGAGIQTEDRVAPVDPELLVSMNLWMFTPELLEVLADGFGPFRQTLTNPLKDEYLLPSVVDEQIRTGNTTVKVLRSDDRWFGMTYREDLPAVRAEIASLYDKGVYKQELYSDIG